MAKRLRDYQKTGERRVLNIDGERVYTPIGFGEVRDLVTRTTRDHERAWAEQGPSAPLIGWRELVRERIYWAHYYAVSVPHVAVVY